MKGKITWLSRGGNFPYQAEGIIGNRQFYFRSRHSNYELQVAYNFIDKNNLGTFSFRGDTINRPCKSNESSVLDDRNAEKVIRRLLKELYK